MSKRLEYTQVKSIFMNNGYQLLSENYKKNSEKLDVICQNGHITKISYCDFALGKRCVDCRKGKKGFNKILTQKEVEEEFKSRGFILLDTYINAKTDLKYQCVCGNITYTRIDRVRQGAKCLKCVGVFRQRKDVENRVKEKRFRKTVVGPLDKCRSRKNLSVTNNDKNKLGYTCIDLWNHIRDHPNWNIVKNQKWVLDHKFPIIAFYDFDINDPKIVNSLDNLQPITFSENNKKANKYDKNDFINWLKTKGVAIEKV